VFNPKELYLAQHVSLIFPISLLALICPIHKKGYRVIPDINRQKAHNTHSHYTNGLCKYHISLIHACALNNMFIFKKYFLFKLLSLQFTMPKACIWCMWTKVSVFQQQLQQRRSTWWMIFQTSRHPWQHRQLLECFW